MLPPWPHPPSATLAEIGEHGVIHWIREAAATIASRDVVLGIGDDGAAVRPARNRLEVLTTDIQVEGVHFAWHLSTPADVGHRVLHVNLSDLAAMGASPRHALLSLGLPATMSGLRLHGVLAGLLDAARAAGVVLIGGNISQAPVLTLDLTLTGAVKARGLLRRSGARPGDEVYVSGDVGAAAAGLAWLTSVGGDATGAPPCLDAAIGRYRRPDARVALGVQVSRNRAASACMDTSDGLADALQQISAASAVGMRIERTLVPLSPAVPDVSALTGADRWRLALAGGDDYELVFTVPRRVRRAFLHVTGRAGFPAVSRIGVCTRETSVVLLDEAGTPQELPDGYVHLMASHAPGA